MIKAPCFYQQPNCSPKLSREHVISKSVLAAVFGSPIRNSVQSDVLGEKILLDHQAVVKDVCRRCNSDLSPYDIAGALLVKELMPSFNAEGLRITVTRETIGWLLKTHLNYFRVIKDSLTQKSYPVDQEIKSSLINSHSLPCSKFKFFVHGIAGLPYYLDANDPRRISWFSYLSLRLLQQNIVVSELRIKCINTWLLLPVNGNYEDFDARVSSTLSELFNDWKVELQALDVKRTIDNGFIEISKILNEDEFMGYLIARARNDQSELPINYQHPNLYF